MFTPWFGGAVVVFMFIFGVYWCYVVLARLPEDVRELRETNEIASKIGIIVVWVITAIIAIVLIGISFMLSVVTISELRSWGLLSS
jgi:uncharacterized membrane protein